jgi:hypothetical protein
MPAQVNSSIITAGNLTPRSTLQAQTESRSRVNTAESNTANSQTILASGPVSLVRSPDPGTGSQGAENQQQAPTPQDTGNGLGQTLDISL